MLPGFRFLFVAIMLSMSLLVFGLGATALLRSAHEEFASNPAWRAAPEVKFAQQTEATMPVLATLRVETPKQKTLEDATAPAAKAEAGETASAPTAAAQPVASRPEQTLSSEVAGPEAPAPMAPKPDVTVADSFRPESDAAPASPQSASVEGGAAAEQLGEGSRQETKDETRVVAIVSTAPSPPDDPPVAAATDQSAAGAAPAAASISTDLATTKIATLGGPPVDTESLIEANGTPSKAKADAGAAKPDESAAKKRAEAKRAARHRRIAAARARLAAQQLQAGPFFQQPTPTVRAR